MDLVTQGIAGAILAQTAGREKHYRYAAICGFIAGLLPDADALIRSSSDPLLTLEFHRQFSHSLLFVPIGALLASLVILPFVRGKLDFGRLYLYCLLGYSSAGLLDACTSYGTQLLWPLSDMRIAWNLIAIVDPLFTLGLIAMLIAGWRSRRRRYAYIAIAYALAYLALAYLQQQNAYQLQTTIAQSRGHTIERSVVKPTLANIVLWRSIYQYQGHYYIDAIRPAMVGESLTYEGNAIAAYRPEEQDMPVATDSIQFNDILRFNKLSDGYLVVHPVDSNVLGDIRYAMLPNSIEPLWGIRLDPDNPDRHVSEALFRKSDESTRQQFINMLLGKLSIID
jgi:inner membrane protein